jgi:N6-adenosine-specific RNA methylase IME4
MDAEPLEPPPVFAPLPTIEGGWACVACDAPLNYDTWSPAGQGRAPSKHYRTHQLEAVATLLPLQPALARGAWVFLWTSGARLEKTRTLMSEWGFTYSTVAFFWFKTKSSNGAGPKLISTSDIEAEFFFGLGKTTRQNVEFCLLGRRGRPKRVARNVRQVIVAPRREHSRKPDEFYERVERFCPGPRLKLFGRESRLGWSVWGDEATKFDLSAPHTDDAPWREPCPR